MFLQLRRYRFQTLDPCTQISSLHSFFEGLWFHIKNLFLRSYLGWLYLGNGCTNFEFSGGIKYIIIFLKSDLVYLFFFLQLNLLPLYFFLGESFFRSFFLNILLITKESPISSSTIWQTYTRYITCTRYITSIWIK